MTADFAARYGPVALVTGRDEAAHGRARRQARLVLPSGTARLTCHRMEITVRIHRVICDSCVPHPVRETCLQKRAAQEGQT